MKKFQLLTTFLTCAAIAFSTIVASADPITITASNWKFAPAAITVHVNQPVTLDLTSAAGVHGLESSALGISKTMIVPGATKTVTFTPTKVGTYIVHCAIPCGPGHSDMTLTIHVVS